MYLPVHTHAIYRVHITLVLLSLTEIIQNLLTGTYTRNVHSTYSISTSVPNRYYTKCTYRYTHAMYTVHDTEGCSQVWVPCLLKLISISSKTTFWKITKISDAYGSKSTLRNSTKLQEYLVGTYSHGTKQKTAYESAWKCVRSAS